VNKKYIDTGAGTDSVKPSAIRTRGFEPVKSEETQKTVEKEKIQTTLLDSGKKNILKSQLEEKLSLLHKRPPSVGNVMSVSEINKALNKAPAPQDDFSDNEDGEGSEEKVVVTVETTSEVKSILKKEGSFETRKMDSVITHLSSAIGETWTL